MTGQLVGRQDVVAAFLADVSELAERRRAVLGVVHGEPGSGATVLLADLADRLARPDGGAAALVVELRGGAGVRGLAGALAGHLAPAAVHRTHLLAVAAGRGPDDVTATAHVLVEAITALTATATVVLLLDEAHRATPACLAVLDLVLAGVAGTRFALLAAHRSGAAALPLPADRTAELRPLDRAQTTDLVAGALELRPDPALITQVRRWLGGLAGNPAAVLDLLAVLRRRGDVLTAGNRALLRPDAELPALPRHNPTRRALAALPEPAPAVFAAVAAVGGITAGEHPALADVLRLAPPATAAALDLLARHGHLLSAAGLLVAAAPAVAAGRVVDCAAGVARALAARLLAWPDRPEDLARTADLLVVAEPGTIDDDTAAAVLAAAQRYLRREPRRVARWCAVALRALPADGAVRPDLLRCQAGAHAAAGQWDSCTAAARALIDAVEPGSAGYGAGVLWWTTALVETGRADLADAVLTDALDTVAGPGRGVLHQQKIRLWMARGELDVVDELIDAAAAEPGAGEQWPLRFARMLVSALRGDLRDYHRHLDRLVSAPIPPAPTSVREDALDAAAFGDFRSVEVALAWRAVPQVGGIVDCYRRARLGLLDGRWDDTLHAGWDLHGYPVTGTTRAAADRCRALAAEVCCRRGRLDDAEAWLAHLDDEQPFPLVVSWVRAGVLAARGEHGGALELAEHAIAANRRRGQHAGLELLLLRMTEHAAEAGAADQARRAARRLREHHDRMPTRGVRLCLHLADAATGRHRAAVEAVHLARLLRRPFEQARALLLTAAGRDDPQRALAAAHQLFTRLDAQPGQRRCAAELTGRGFEVPAAAGRTELTMRERQVGALIARGLTNHRIAQLLGLTDKTVERHVTHLLRKTGARSRVHLATGWPPDTGPG